MGESGRAERADHMVAVDVNHFKALCVARIPKYLERAKYTSRIGLSHETVRQITSCADDYAFISRTKLYAFCEATGADPRQLIHRLKLPSDPAFYEMLKHSVYADHLPIPKLDVKAQQHADDVFWRRESTSIKLKRTARPQGYDPRPIFRVDLTNANGVSLRGVAALNSDSHFVMSIAPCDRLAKDRTQPQIAFDAVFSQVIRCLRRQPDGELAAFFVLAGVWIGTSPLMEQSIYPMLLSPYELLAREVDELSPKAKAKCFVPAESTFV